MRCGMHASKHRSRNERAPRKDHRSRRPIDRIIGIDGEGIGREPHRYIYLAGCDETGHSWEVGRDNRLSSIECFEFLCSLPQRTLVVGFSLGYDVAKWIEDLPDKAIYALMHEEMRQWLAPNGMVVYRPIHWNGFKINYMNKRFTIAREGENRSTTIWDIFRFFQSSFVKSLEAWKVCPQEEIDEIERMKEQRSILEQIPREEVHAYCQKECLNLTKLTRSLIEAHKAADLELKTYYGAGSTASVFLAKQGIAEKRGEVPEEMRLPLASAFFGGRFENSVVGPIEGMVYGYDISSAYPYQTTMLPCLQCGHWVHHKNTRDASKLAGRICLVHWRSSQASHWAPWGTLPVRAKDGTIVFPIAGAGGWTWREEFKAAQELNPTLEATEAWSYETDCNHRPFVDVPRYYRERIALGKEAKGIVLKLGINSIYGKLAQSKGVNPPFQSWVWASSITSGTRAQLLRAISNAQRRESILMLATDGIYSRERLRLEVPDDTGTFDCRNKRGDAVPLGGWEEKEHPQGVFCVRPGIYFPLNPNDEQINEVRGRGIGRKALYNAWKTIVEAWDANKMSVAIGGMQRFVGAKTGVLGVRDAETKKLKSITRRDCYGDWVDHTINVSFSPRPKRQAINEDGTLEPWGYFDFESHPYLPATISPDALMLKLAEQIAEEQPDGDVADFQ